MLKIDDLHVSYGGIRALRGISLEVPDGKIVTLIGANGAGKSTTLRTISGLVKADSGSVTYDGQELLGKPINKVLEAGIAQSPEGRRVFPNLTVLENVELPLIYLRVMRCCNSSRVAVACFPCSRNCLVSSISSKNFATVVKYSFQGSNSAPWKSSPGISRIRRSASSRRSCKISLSSIYLLTPYFQMTVVCSHAPASGCHILQPAPQIQ